MPQLHAAVRGPLAYAQPSSDIAVPDADRERSRRDPGHGMGRRWTAGGFALVALVGALAGWRRAEAPYADGDVLWGARAGREFLEHGKVPHVDSYSWTVSGRPWIPNSWGWDVLLGAADGLAGLVGIALLGIAMMAGIGITLAAAARRAGGTPVWTAILFQIVAGVFALFMYPRAQIIDYAMIFIVPLLALGALDGARRRYWRNAGLIIAVQIGWMNLHSAAVLGPVLVAAVGAGVAISRRELRGRTLLQTAGLAAMSATACLGTPYGTTSITHLAAVRDASVGLISEWRPVGLGSAEQVLGLVSLVLGAVAGGLALRARRMDTVAVLAVLGIATAMAIRFAPMIALYAVPELAAAAGRIRVREFFLNRVCAATIAILAIACAAEMTGFAAPGAQNASPSLVKALPAGCRLLNDLEIGGDVIRSRPDVRVSIDSRNDLYGRAREVRSLDQLSSPRSGLAFIRRTGVTCVLAPTKAPLVSALRAASGWQVLATDTVRTLLVRRSSA